MFSRFTRSKVSSTYGQYNLITPLLINGLIMFNLFVVDTIANSQLKIVFLEVYISYQFS